MIRFALVLLLLFGVVSILLCAAYRGVRSWSLFTYQLNPYRRWCKLCGRRQELWEVGANYQQEWRISAEESPDGKRCECENYCDGYDSFWR